MAEQGKNETETFTSSMDARLWAKAFLKTYENLPGGQGLDEDFVTTWFETAIMRGYDAGAAKQKLDKEPQISSEHVLRHISEIEERKERERLVAPSEWYQAYGSMRVAEGVERLNATLLYLFQDAAVPEKPDKAAVDR